MPFCRTRLSAKCFIAGVGGYPPASLPNATPSRGSSPAAAPSFSLPIMRWATSHTASIAPIISCLPITTSSSRHSSSAVNPGVDQRRIRLFKNPEKRQPSLSGYDVLSLRNEESLFLESANNLGAGGRSADAFGFLQSLPQHLVVNETPGVLHRLDQSALIVSRRGPRLFVLNGSCLLY